MPFDPSSFHANNITDACAVWNVLSSRTLHAAARGTGVVFICTRFVLHECLFKPRRTVGACDVELQTRLRAAQMDSCFATYPLEVADLQWLFFGNRLGDTDKDTIIKEHEAMGRHPGRYFEEAYLEACRYRLMANYSAGAK